MNSNQYSARQFHQQSKVPGAGRLSAAKRIFYAAILVAGFGCANSVWAALLPLGGTTTTTIQPFSPPQTFTPPLACTSPSFIKCDGTNDKTCSKRCDAKLDSFPPATTRDGRPLHSGVSATGYKVYDIVCPPGYATGNPRVLAGAQYPQVRATSHSNYATLMDRGYTCYDSAPVTYTFKQDWNSQPSASLPTVGQWIDAQNIVGCVTNTQMVCVPTWLGTVCTPQTITTCGAMTNRYLYVTSVVNNTRCWTRFAGRIGCGGAHCKVCHRFSTWSTNQYLYDRCDNGPGSECTYCYHNCGGTCDTDWTFVGCDRMNYDVTGYEKICNAPFFPQGEPMIQNVCIYAGPNYVSQPESAAGTTNCVPASTTSSSGGSSGPGVQGSSGSATNPASAANICPPKVVPQKYGPGSTVLPTTQ